MGRKRERPTIADLEAAIAREDEEELDDYLTNYDERPFLARETRPQSDIAEASAGEADAADAR